MITPPKSPRSSERARPVRRLCFFWSRKKPQTAGRLDDRLAALPLSPKPRSEPFFQGPALCTGPVYSQGLRASPPTFVTLLLFGAATLLLKRFKDWPGQPYRHTRRPGFTITFPGLFLYHPQNRPKFSLVHCATGRGLYASVLWRTVGPVGTLSLAGSAMAAAILETERLVILPDIHSLIINEVSMRGRVHTASDE